MGWDFCSQGSTPRPTPIGCQSTPRSIPTHETCGVEKQKGRFPQFRLRTRAATSPLASIESVARPPRGVEDKLHHPWWKPKMMKFRRMTLGRRARTKGRFACEKRPPLDLLHLSGYRRFLAMAIGRISCVSDTTTFSQLPKRENDDSLTDVANREAAAFRKQIDPSCGLGVPRSSAGF